MTKGNCILELGYDGLEEQKRRSSMKRLGFFSGILFLFLIFSRDGVGGVQTREHNDDYRTLFEHGCVQHGRHNDARWKKSIRLEGSMERR